METFLLILVIASDIAALVLFIFACMQSPSKEQKLMMMLTVMNVVMNMAFSFQVLAWDESSSEMANIIMHFAALQMGLGFLLIFCRITFINMSGIIRTSMVMANLGVSVLFATDHYLHLMYDGKSYEQFGCIKLVKVDMGPMYWMYLMINVLYLVSILFCIGLCAVKKRYIFRNRRLRTNVIFFMVAGIIMICAMMLSLLFDVGFDYSVPACCLSTVLLMIIMYRNRIYDMRGNMQEDILDEMDDIILAHDRNRCFLYANAHCMKVFPELREYRNGMPLDSVSDELKQIFCLKEKENFIKDDETYSVEVRTVVRNQKKDGTVFWLKNITKENNYIIELEYLKEKLSEKVELQDEEIKKTKEELERLSNNRADAFDVTTGLLIRASGEKNIAMAMKETAGALIFFDVDNLKKINDIYGHEAGDRSLRYMGQVLKKEKNAISCRLGGDEFLCFLRGYNEKAAEEKARSFISDYFELKEADIETRPASVSAGVTITQIDSEFAESLKEADKALYHVKQNGKADVFVYRNSAESDDIINEINLEMFAKGLEKAAGCDGALNVEFRQFSKLYQYVRNMESRFNTSYILMMIELVNSSENEVAADEMERAMQAMQRALMDTIRNVDVYTRYGRNRFLLITTGANEINFGSITDRIIRRYHALYTEDIFEPAYEYLKHRE